MTAAVNAPAPAPAASETDPVVTFVTPPPGLAPLRDFDLHPLDEDGVLFSLRARATSPDEPAPGVRLFLLQPAAHLADYAPEPTAEHLAQLGDGTHPARAEDVATLVVLNPGDHEDGGPTVNLLAPVLVDKRTHRALQVVLEGDWPLRAPLA